MTYIDCRAEGRSLAIGDRPLGRRRNVREGARTDFMHRSGKGVAGRDKGRNSELSRVVRVLIVFIDSKI